MFELLYICIALWQSMHLMVNIWVASAVSLVLSKCTTRDCRRCCHVMSVRGIPSAGPIMWRADGCHKFSANLTARSRAEILRERSNGGNASKCPARIVNGIRFYFLFAQVIVIPLSRHSVSFGLL